MEARQASSSFADNQDLVIEVLSRLPIKSVLKFTSVSKAWSALIKSSRFIAIHQKRLQGSNPNLCLLYGRIVKNEYCIYHKPHKVSVLIGEEDTHLVALDLPERVQQDCYDKVIHIAGCSDGLVCLRRWDTSEEEKIIVWNPATKKHTYLPRPLSFKGRERTGGDPLLGFGFVNVDNGQNDAAEYKVVRISRSKHRDGDGMFTYLTQVFTRSENSWREVKNCVPPGDYHFESHSSITSNGVLYCLASIMSVRYVFSFDLHDEVVQNMPMPPRYSYYKEEQLFTWENSAAFLTCVQGQYHLWVMKKEPDTQTPTWNWTAQFTIKNPGRQISGKFYPFLTDDFCLFVKRHVRAGQDLVKYDQATNKASKAFQRATGCSYHQRVDYVQSLVSVL